MIKRSSFLTVVFVGSLSLIGGVITSVQAQVDTAWVRRYNGPADEMDIATAMTVDNFGNVYVTGYSTGNGTGWDYATIKYYPNGDTAWVRRYNEPVDASDYPVGIAVSDSGYIYVTGWSSQGPNYDYVTIKYRSNGDTAWIRRYNGPGDSNDAPYGIALDDSGYIYVTGKSYSSGTGYDYATIKYKTNGDTAWVRRYDGPANLWDEAHAVTVDASGDVYVTGISPGSGTSLDYATVKYYPNGDTAWVRRYNGAGNGDDYANAIAVDKMGNTYVTGYSYGNGTANDYVTIKYYPDGTPAWIGVYNGPANLNNDDKANAIAVDDSGNIYVTGQSVDNFTWYDYCTIKYRSNGDTAWVRRFNNSPSNSGDYPSAITVDGSGNVYVTGWSFDWVNVEYYDYATVKYYSDGDSAWVMRYNGPADTTDQAYAIAVDDSGNVYVTGYSFGVGTDRDYATIKYSELVSEVKDETQVTEKPYEFNLSQNYPNPFNPTTSIRYTVDNPQSTVHGSIRTTLKIYDVLGEEVKTLIDEKEFPGEYTVPWDGRNEKGEPLASGVYLYELRVGNHTSSKKMVLLK
jgi:uncharacterized delta-60 repeat protein